MSRDVLLRYIGVALLSPTIAFLTDVCPQPLQLRLLQAESHNHIRDGSSRRFLGDRCCFFAHVF